MVATNHQDLVSILIPAYNDRFFEVALKSVLSQTYPNVEIIVCDDSEGAKINRIVDQLKTDCLRYDKNEKNLGFSANFTRCFRMASGVYIKYLNDDDLLHSECVERMIRMFHSGGREIKLVFSKRAIIDENGRRQPDMPINVPLSRSNTRIKGSELADFVLKHSTNFIGEPSTVMFRRSDVSIEGERIFQFGGVDYHCLADLSLWLRLLSKGDAIYLKDELSCFRVHGGQEQIKQDVAIKCLTERYELLKQSSALGFLADIESRNAAANALLKILDHALASNTITEKYQVQLEIVRRRTACMRS
jgi:glycosyltransferase involved in cell wall biosynthesis